MIKIDTITETLQLDLFQKKIYVVYNETEYYIHNGIDTLVKLRGNFDYIVTQEQLFNSTSNCGTHILAECDTLDIALEAFTQWKFLNKII